MEQTDDVHEAIQLADGESRDQDAEDENNERGHWSSQFEYLLSVIGFSVGLGNLWRFPYICNRNGGGAFLIPFFLCLVLCGLPLFFLEVAIGQFSGKGAAHVWSLCPLMKGIGIGMVVIALGDPVFYTVISAWSLFYTIASCRAVLPWTTCDNPWNTANCVTSVQLLKHNKDMNSSIADNNASFSLVSLYQINASYVNVGWDNQMLSHTAAEEFWQYKVLGITNGLEEIGHIRWELALCLLGSWFIIFLCVVKGIKSVGKAVYITATFPYALLTVLLVRGLTLPGGPSGVLYYITPDFSKLLDVQVWLEASLQVLWSLGAVQGGLITMASYNKFHTNCLRNTLICTFVSEGTSLFAGLVVFSILGFMAHEAGVPISEVVSSGPGLGFVTYPEVLAQFPVPQLWSFIFFIMLIFLAMDTLFGIIETILSAILDEFPSLLKWRVPVTAAYCITCFLLGLVLTTQGGMYIFQLIDWYFAMVFFMLAGFFECVVLGWLYGVNRLSDDIEMMIGRQAPVFFKVTWRYVTPVILMLTVILTLCQYEPPTYGKYIFPGYASTIGWCLAIAPLLPIAIMAILTVYRGKGSMKQRLRQSLVPDKSWGPCKVAYRRQYYERHSTSESFNVKCNGSVSCRNI